MKKVYGIVFILLIMTGLNYGQFTKLWESNVGAYTWFANDHTTRGLDINPATGHLLVASRTGTHAIYVLNAQTGIVLDTLDMTGISGGTYALNIVRVAADGIIYACNLAVANQALKVYRWANEQSVPTLAFEGTVTLRAGDALAVSGSGVNTRIYASGSSNTTIEVLNTTDGLVFTKGNAITLPGAGYARGGISPISDVQEGGFWINGAGTEATHIDGSGTKVASASGTVIASGFYNVKYFERAGSKYIAVVGKNLASDGLQLKIYDITASETLPKHFLTLSLSNAYNGNSNAAGDVAVVVNPVDDSFIVYQLVTNNGIAAYKTNLMTIARAREDLNGDFKPDRLTDTLTVTGVVISPNYQTTNVSYYIWDGTASIDAFKYGLKPTLNLGDSIRVTGKIEQYNGLVEIVAPDTNNIVVLKSGAVLPVPQEITIAQYKANHDLYEGSLITIRNVTKYSGTWPANANGTVKVTNGTDSIDVYIDKDTEVDNSPEPVWPQDITGIASQFSSTSLTGGLQILPRYNTDFQVPVPVELASFKSNVSGNNVVLSWQTATETNNMGFEVYRNNEKVKFIPGFGTTSEKRSYSYEDNGLSTGKYSYRLVQVDYSGAKETVGNIEVEVNAAPAAFTLGQNYPNPFNPSTVIAFTLPVDAKVSLRILNVLGEEVTNLVNSNMSSGSHQVTFNASSMNSGIYFYTIEVNGADGSNFSNTKKMMLIK